MAPEELRDDRLEIQVDHDECRAGDASASLATGCSVPVTRAPCRSDRRAGDGDTMATPSPARGASESLRSLAFRRGRL